MKLEKYEDCVNDCTKGLGMIAREEEILSKELKQDDGGSDTRKNMKTKLFVRRGTCSVQLGDIKGGFNDYSAASELDPTNESLIEDINGLKELMNIDGSNL